MLFPHAMHSVAMRAHQRSDLVPAEVVTERDPVAERPRQRLEGGEVANGVPVGRADDGEPDVRNPFAHPRENAHDALVLLLRGEAANREKMRDAFGPR